MDYNKQIFDLKARINDIMLYYQKNNIEWSIPEFEAKLFNKYNPVSSNVSEFLQAEIKDMHDRGHYGNSTIYNRLLLSLNSFDKDFSKRSFHDIDYNYVRRYDSFMETNGNKGNTRMIQMRTLRALFNRAIKQGIVERKYYPFGMDGFSVYKLKEKTQKRYLASGEIQKVVDARFDNLRLETARRTFLSMYYLQGMAFTDAAHLRRSKNIITRDDQEFVHYKRIKTQHQPNADFIEIEISPYLRDHLDWFAKHNLLIHDYIFPIVSVPKNDQKELYDHIKGRYKKVNEAFKDMAKELKIPPEALTTYVTRHSFAMDMQNNDVPREVIKELMGHQDIKTTQDYLDSFPSSKKKVYMGSSPVFTRDPKTSPVRYPNIRKKGGPSKM